LSDEFSSKLKLSWTKLWPDELRHLAIKSWTALVELDRANGFQSDIQDTFIDESHFVENCQRRFLSKIVNDYFGLQGYRAAYLSFTTKAGLPPSGIPQGGKRMKGV
jgi:hypothetical protein